MLNRKKIIRDFIAKDGASINELLPKVNNLLGKKISKITLIRDIDELIKDGLVHRQGKGPSVRYYVAETAALLEEIDRNEYFAKDQGERGAKKEFDFEIFKLLSDTDIFSAEQRRQLGEMNAEYAINFEKLPKEIVNREYERLMIELSWKSSRIEGNTYDLLETEFLIRENREAKGHSRLEARMILNHKDALETARKSRIKIISLENIGKIHTTLIKEMGISEKIRSKPVGITGTDYRPLSVASEISMAMESLCWLVNSKKDVFEKCLILNLLIAYIQPYNDGNKRTSRLMGNAVLIANAYCPLSFRSIDELEYKKAVILFYEQNNLHYFRQLFIEQFAFAVRNYFRA